MEIINLLSSVSKVALIAFFLTVVAIFVELFLINRQTRRKDDLEIPEFKPETLQLEGNINATPLKPEIIAKLEILNKLR